MKTENKTRYPLTRPDLGTRLKQGVAILGFLFVIHFLIDALVAGVFLWSLLF